MSRFGRRTSRSAYIGLWAFAPKGLGLGARAPTIAGAKALESLAVHVARSLY